MNHKSQFSIGKYRFRNGIMMALGDGVSMSVAFCIAGIIRVLIFDEPFLPGWGWYIYPLWWGGAILMRILPSWGLGPVEELRRMTILQLFVHSTTGVALLVSNAGSVSLISLLIVLVISSWLIPSTRLKVKRFLISAHQWGVPVVVYGTGETAVQVVRLLYHERGLGYNPIGVVENGNTVISGEWINDIPVCKDSEIDRNQVPVAIVALEGMSRNKLSDMLEKELAGYFKVMVIPELFEVPSLWVKPRDISGILGLEITSNLLSPFARFTKRAIEMTLVVASIPVWVPLCLLTAVLIQITQRTTPFFLQERVGKGGKIFRTWKFRTMVNDAESTLAKRLAEDNGLQEEWTAFHKLKNDPRVTPLGKILRRFSIDELPQLLNVLRGEMSLVGPRPLPKYHIEKLSERVRELRERVRPGLTGLWQVSGRSDKAGEMERMDSYYVRNWSPWLDMVVLVRTFRAVVHGEGAY